jgi:hypothetical protein
MLAVLLVAATAAGGAAAAGPAKKHTSAGNASARASLLSAKDLGTGWKVTAAISQQAPSFQCRGYQPNEDDLVEIGAATSPSFSASGAIIQQYTAVFATAGQASTLWGRAVKRGLVNCVAQTLASIQSKGIKVSDLSGGTVGMPKPIAKTMVYRVIATLKAGNRALRTYFDVIVLSSGKTVTEVTISTFGNPVPAKSELALAQVVAKRLGNPTA